MAIETVVKINNYNAYKGRNDVVYNSWFRCSNRLLEDPDFFDFTHEEILVWIYILSLASQKNTDTVCIKFAHAERVCRLKKSAVESAIKKLQAIQILPVDDTDTLRERNADDTFTCATEKTEKTEITPAAVSLTAESVMEIWNANCAPFPKIKQLNKKRRELIKKLLADFKEPQQFVQAVATARENRFNCGENDSKWTANFDWFIREGKMLSLLERSESGDASTASLNLEEMPWS